MPNGLAFSPDESILYINDSRKGIIRAFDVQDDSTLALASDRLFADMRPDAREGIPDGMKVDAEGNVYCGGSGGIHILSPGGERLGIVVHGQPATTNLCFGDGDWKSVFFTTRENIGSFRVKMPGVPVPASSTK